MKNLPSYQEQYNKIIDAYFKDEIKPLDDKFCFCGTLCDNTIKWFNPNAESSHYKSHGYTGRELYRMEAALFNGISNGGNKWDVWSKQSCED